MTSGPEEIGLFRRLNLVMRFSYTLPFVLASICGVAYGLRYSNEYLIALLIPLDVLFLAMFVNFSNDYFDFVSGVDIEVGKERFEKLEESPVFKDNDLLKKVYWDGNQFERGLITVEQGRMVMAFLVLMSLLLAVPILLHGGLLVIVLGLAGLLLAYFYTAPPINMGARGLGELNVGISFFMLVFFSHYVLSGVFSWEIVVFSLAIGLAVGLMRVVDAMSGYESHLKHGEKDLAVRMGGREQAVPVIKIIQATFVALLAVMVLFHPIYVILLLTVPLVLRSWRAMDAKEELWYVRIAPQYFGVSLLTMVLYIIALSVRTFLTSL